MLHPLHLTTIAAATSFALWGCNPQSTQPTVTETTTAAPVGQTGATTDNMEHVDGPAARHLVEDGAFLLDVRTPEEFAEGHIEGATNIPVQELETRMSEVPESASVVVYCRSGNRSAKAAVMLKDAGHQVHDLGPMSAW